MKSIRRGLGRGKGMGYKNIVPHDRPVHRDSGRGIKQPQIKMIPPVMMKQGMRKSPYHKFTTEDYYNMGKRSGLGGYSLKKYSAFMQLRFPEETDPAYAREWARAFSEGKEYVKADVESQRILDNLDSSPFIELIQKDVGGLGEKKYGVFDAYGFIITAFDKKEDAEKYAQANKGGDFFVKEVEIEDHTKEKVVGGLGDKSADDMTTSELNDFIKGCSAQEADRKLRSIGFSLKKLRDVNMMASGDIIEGGLGDNRPDSDFPKAELKKGMKVEAEHTNNPAIAKEIVKDHLTEFSGTGKKGYYDNLDKMEKKLKKQQKTSHFHFKGEYPNLKKYQR